MNRTYDSSFESHNNSIYKAFHTLLTILKDNRIEIRDDCYTQELEETLLFHCFQSIWRYKLNQEKSSNSSSLSHLTGISKDTRDMPLISFNNSLTSLNKSIIDYIRSIPFDLLLHLPPLIHDYFLGIKSVSPLDLDKEKEKEFSGKRKKTGGIYYTPQWIAESMTQASIQPFLDRFLIDMKMAAEKDSLEDFSQVWKKAVNFKILDPACGWGIFLINAVKLLQSFYYESGKLAKRLIESAENNNRTHELYNCSCYALIKDASLAGENSSQIILSKNLFGFDVDEIALKITENVIAAKSSAEYINLKKQQTLYSSSLSSHINKMDFIKEYSQIEHKFDVILGNPPYFSIGGGGRKREKTPYHLILKNHPFFSRYFRSQSDIFYYFIIGSIHLLKQGGILSFITPSYWFDNDYADRLRKEILDTCRIKEIVRFDPYKVFYSIEGKPVNVDTSIFRLKRIDSVLKQNIKQEQLFLPLLESNVNAEFCEEQPEAKSYAADDYKFEVYLFNKDFASLTDTIKDSHNNITFLQKELYDKKLIKGVYSQKHLSAGRWNFTSCQSILDVMKKDGRTIFPLGDISSREREKFEGEFTSGGGKECEGLAWIGQGQETGLSEVFVIKEEDVHRLNLEKELLRPNIKNGNIRRYVILPSKQQVIITLNHHSMDEYPNLLKYLTLHKNKLLKRQRVRIGVRKWYAVSIPHNYAIFAKEEKIVVPYRAAFNRFALDRQGSFNDGGDVRAVVIKSGNLHTITHNVLLAILNSQLLNFWFMQAGKGKGGMYEYFSRPLSRIPVKIPSAQVISLLQQCSISLQKLYECYNDDNSGSFALKKDKSILKKEIDEYEGKIDEAVFELYGITYKQKSVITSFIKESRKRNKKI